MNEEIKTLFDALTGKVEEMKSQALKTEDLDALKADLESLKGLETKLTAEQSKQFEALKEEINQIKEMGGVKEKELDFRSIVEKALTENKQAIKEAFENKSTSLKSLEEVNKAVGIVTTANGTLPVALPANFVAYQQGVPNVNLRKPTLLNYVNTFNTNKTAIAYVEAVAGEGDFAVVAEGAVKPQLDLDWVTRHVGAQKFAGWIKVTDEVVEDIPRLTDMVVNYLKGKHDIFKEKQVFNYINTNATAYVAGGGLAGSTLMPTIVDVANAMNSQILNTPNYTDEGDFMADTVALNPVDFLRYFSFAKDSLGRPLFDGSVIGNKQEIVFGGYTFVGTSLVTAGNIVVFDSTKIDVTNYKPYAVSYGWVNDDFIKNQFVILGESRGHIYIKEHDKRAFVKASISAVIADLTPTTGE